MTVAQDHEFITVAEAAELYGVTRAAVYEWMRRGRIQRYERGLPSKVFVDMREIEKLREIHPVKDEKSGE